jgi:hypothetical protein
MIEFFQGFHIKLAQYLSYNSKELVTNPRWFMMRRIGRFFVVRRCKAASYKYYNLSQIQQSKSSIFTNINVDKIIANLKKYGLHQGLQLPNTIFIMKMHIIILNPRNLSGGWGI